MGHVTVLVKATRLCNLRCTYCHDWRTGRGQTMDFLVLARLTAAALRDPTHDSVRFTWHGGEPTLMPITFYQKALLLQSRFRRPGQIVTNSIQTNGTRLTPLWARFLRDNQFVVGLSIDGPPEVHDRYRRYASGRATFADVAEAIELLRHHRVPFGVLVVVDEVGLELGPDRLFDFCTEMKIRQYGLNFAAPINQPDAPRGTSIDHYIEPQRMIPFLKRLYQRWRQFGDPNLRIREIDALRSRIAAKSTYFCTVSGGCFGGFFGVEPDGEVTHCVDFVGDDRYVLGNILDRDFGAMRHSPQFEVLAAENNHALARMRSCPNFAVCNGWCPRERYTSVRHNPIHRDECCGLSELIDYIRDQEKADVFRLPLLGTP
jgi:uncharacterized protein